MGDLRGSFTSCDKNSPRGERIKDIFNIGVAEDNDESDTEKQPKALVVALHHIHPEILPLRILKERNTGSSTFNISIVPDVVTKKFVKKVVKVGYCDEDLHNLMEDMYWTVPTYPDAAADLERMKALQSQNKLVFHSLSLEQCEELRLHFTYKIELEKIRNRMRQADHKERKMVEAVDEAKDIRAKAANPLVRPCRTENFVKQQTQRRKNNLQSKKRQKRKLECDHKRQEENAKHLQRLRDRQERPLVLLFGMSFAMCKKDRGNQQDPATFGNFLQNLPAVVNATKEDRIKAKDGRDLARILTLREKCNAECITVSLDGKGSRAPEYRPDRHIHGNFNNRRFIRDLNGLLGNRRNPKFQQVTLDWFYAPPNYTDNNWDVGFFHKTLPRLAELKLLVNPFTENCGELFQNGYGVGCIYIPFCTFTVDSVGKGPVFKALCDYYDISFLIKEQMGECMLYYSTLTIKPDDMEAFFDKKLDQKEVFNIKGTAQLTLLGQKLVERCGDLTKVASYRMIKFQLKP